MHLSAFILDDVHAFPIILMAGVFNTMLFIVANFINAFVQFACLSCNKLENAL